MLLLFSSSFIYSVLLKNVKKVYVKKVLPIKKIAKKIKKKERKK